MLENARKARAYVVTTLSGEAKSKKSDLNVLQSAVWDGNHPMSLNFPTRSVLEKTKRGLRIRKLDGKIGERIEDAATEITFDKLHEEPENLLEIPNKGNKSRLHLFVNIHPVTTEEPINTRIGPLPVISVPLSQGIDRSEQYRNTQVSVFAFLILCIVALQFWHPKPPSQDELIPPEYAKLLLSPTLHARQEIKAEEEKKAAPAYQVAKAFQNKEVKKTTSQLFNVGRVKDLLAKSTLLSATNSKKVVHNIFNGSDMIKTLGNSAVPSMNGKVGAGSADAEGSKNANHYGISTSGLEDQGKSFLSVVPKNIEIDEGLTKEEVGKVVRTHLGEVRYCYESAMVRSPSLEGKLVASFVILGNGAVDKASAKQSSGDAALDSCILEHLSKWKFPAPRGKESVHVSYPFIFKVLEG